MPLRCPSCDSSAVVHDQLRGELICTRCGLVIVEKQLSPGPDWHMMPSERVGRADVGAGLDITQHDLISIRLRAVGDFVMQKRRFDIKTGERSARNNTHPTS